MDPILNKSAERLIWVAEPSLGVEEERALAQCAKDDWISQGPRVAEFEDLIANSCDKKYGSACNSGTTALHLALRVEGVSEKSHHVIIPNLTMVALANAVLMAGGTPVFAEVVGNVGNLSLDTIKEEVTPMTKAVIVVHTYGEPVKDIEEIVDWCKRRGISLIEDCAEAHFARHNNKPVGSFADTSIFSFYSNKNITCGEGGMVVTDSPYVKERLDRIRMHAFTPGKHFCHTEEAFGYRMTDMQAAIGIEQFKKSKRFMVDRAIYRAMYNDRLRNNPLVKIPETTKTSGFWVMPVLARDETSRDGMREFLADHGIDTRTYFQPMHEQRFLTRYGTSLSGYGRSIELSRRGFYLPLYPKLSADDINYIAQRLNRYHD